MTLFNGNLGGDQGDQLAQTALGTEIEISQASLADSWKRSSSFGLDPNGKPVDAVISETELYQSNQKNEHITQFVMPELELLYNQIAGTNFMVAYADSEGVVINALRDEDFKNSDAGKAVIPGSIWTEQYRGTNALGLCLHTGSSQIVAGREHFFHRLGNLSCFAAPIYNPNNEIVGMIDATSDASSRQHHTLALVKLACKNVENRLFTDAFEHSLIISFHARHEYLGTTSAALLAIDEHGFIDGANTNAKMMLNGLNLSHKRHFGDIFSIPFSNIITRLSSNEIIRIHDVMGSAVFMAMKESTTKRIVDIDLQNRSKAPNIKLLPQVSQADKKDPENVKIKRSYIAEDAGLKRHLLMAKNALKYDLPVFIEGARGSGKKATATELHRLLFCEQPFVEIKCNLLTAENYDEMLFGEAGRLAYFQPSSSIFSASLLDKARNGSLFLNGIEALPIVAQKALIQVLEERQEAQIDQGKTEISAVFSSSRLSFTELKASEDLDPVFLEALQGSQVVLPHLSQRLDFRLLATELLYQVSPSHKFSKSALDALQKRDWPGQVKQLKRTIQMLLANAEGPIIRAEAISGGTQHKSEELTPCVACSNSPVRKESCVLIKKTWLETGGNVSLVSRRLGVSRTTIYKHLSSE